MMKKEYKTPAIKTMVADTENLLEGSIVVDIPNDGQDGVTFDAKENANPHYNVWDE